MLSKIRRCKLLTMNDSEMKSYITSLLHTVATSRDVSKQFEKCINNMLNDTSLRWNTLKALGIRLNEGYGIFFGTFMVLDPVGDFADIIQKDFIRHYTEQFGHIQVNGSLRSIYSLAREILIPDYYEPLRKFMIAGCGKGMLQKLKDRVYLYFYCCVNFNNVRDRANVKYHAKYYAHAEMLLNELQNIHEKELVA